MNKNSEPDLARVEGRENHLWWITLFLLFLFAVVTAVAFYFLIDPSTMDQGLARAIRPTALGGLVLLTLLFSVYVLQARMNFSKLRILYQRQALRDSLTGLLSRHSIDDRLLEEMARADREEGVLPILLSDLDGFKEINDSMGHQAGDRILRLVAERVLEATRGSDLVFRWGGDEFLVLLSSTDRKGALIAAKRISKGVQKVGESQGVRLDLSVGIAFYPEHARTAKELVSMAERALLIAKKGGDKIHIGEEEHQVNDQSIHIVYQPIVDMKDGRTIGFEALGRDPEGKVSIATIFRRYAAVGQLAELKQFIFRQQIREAEEHQLEKVFVNIDFETLEATEPFPKPEGTDVVLEISEEESLRNIEAHLETTECWRKFGFKFAIDDFGAGFMSLPFIARMVPDYIKIDRQTIVEATESTQFSDFLRDLVKAMRNYSKDGIIAEGIETESELKVVRRLGVDQVQGFLTGRPESLPVKTGRVP